MMRFTPALFLALFCCVVVFTQTAPPKAKDTQQNEPTIRIETELVQIEVIVTDKAGKPVRDLRREDFELKEDGKPQDVSYFSVGTATSPAHWVTTGIKANGTTPTPATTPAPEVRAGRYIVLAIDDLHLAFSSLVYARQALTKFVDEQITSDDQVALTRPPHGDDRPDAG